MSNTNLIIGTIAVLALALAGYGLVGGNNQSTFGGSTSDNWLVGQEIVGNDDGGDNDSRIEGDTDANLLYVDAGNDRLGVSTSTPVDLFHVENGSATSTAIISSGGSAVGGRIILEDHDGAGCSEIAILDGTIAAKTVTCPSGI